MYCFLPYAIPIQIININPVVYDRNISKQVFFFPSRMVFVSVLESQAFYSLQRNPSEEKLSKKILKYLFSRSIQVNPKFFVKCCFKTVI